MNKICTSKEQSQKLIELGIDTSTADMYWDYDYDIQRGYKYYPRVMDEQFDDVCISAWSLSALLGLMPKIHEYETDAGCQPILCKGWDNFQWHVVYRSSIHITEWYDDPLDAAFEMIIWLKENGKI